MSETMELPINYDEATRELRKAAREEYMMRQNGLCYHCKNPLAGQASEEMLAKEITPRLYPPNFFKYPVHLHHDHTTGMTRGAVHCYCNAVLWEYHGE